MARCFLFLFLLAASASAQFISLGIKGGVPVNDEFQTSFNYRNEAKRYVVGPMLQINLPMRFAVEVDGLYRRIGYSTNTTDILGNLFNAAVRANSWEIPVIVKYHLTPGLIRPYVGAGYAVQGITNVSGAVSAFSKTVFNPEANLINNPAHGVVVEGGVQIRALFLKIEPEFRYTHWKDPAFSLNGSQGAFLQSDQNQYEFLVGIRF